MTLLGNSNLGTLHVGSFVFALANPTLACSSCQWAALGPGMGSLGLLFLVWIIGVLFTTYYAHRLKVNAGKIPPEKTNPVWGHAAVFLALIFLGGPVIGPVAVFFAGLLAGVTSLSNLWAPKPLPIFVLLLHGALIASLFYMRSLNIEKVQRAGGPEIWTLLHHRPDSRALQGLVYKKDSDQLESLLQKARRNDEIPEETMIWLENRVDHIRREEQSEEQEIKDRREKAERRHLQQQQRLSAPSLKVPINE